MLSYRYSFSSEIEFFFAVVMQYIFLLSEILFYLRFFVGKFIMLTVTFQEEKNARSF